MEPTEWMKSSEGGKGSGRVAAKNKF